jgi:hypothetical protein
VDDGRGRVSTFDDPPVLEVTQERRPAGLDHVGQGLLLAIELAERLGDVPGGDRADRLDVAGAGDARLQGAVEGRRQDRLGPTADLAELLSQ